MISSRQKSYQLAMLAKIAFSKVIVNILYTPEKVKAYTFTLSVKIKVIYSI